MTAQDNLVHHEAVHPLHHTLALHKGEELAQHDGNDAELVRRFVQVDGHTPLQQVVAHLSVGVPGGYLPARRGQYTLRIRAFKYL